MISQREQNAEGQKQEHIAHHIRNRKAAPRFELQRVGEECLQFWSKIFRRRVKRKGNDRRVNNKRSVEQEQVEY